MAVVEIPGIGAASYLPEEEAFLRRLRASGSPTCDREVALYHALKVYLGARPLAPGGAGGYVQLALEGVAR